MRKVRHEAHRIHQHQRASGRQRHPPQGRVQGREELIGGMHSCARQPIEEGRLAGVRVADERHHRDPRALPRPAVDLAPAFDGVELPADSLDALADEAPIGLELGLARATKSDAAALPFEVGPAAHEAGRQVPKLRELHLEPAFERRRALGEYVEDEADPVDHSALEQRLEVALLGRREAVVEDGELDRARLDPTAKLLGLSGTDEIARIGAAGRGGDELDRLRSRRADELDELLRRSFRVFPPGPHMHEQGPCTRRGAVEEFRDSALHFGAADARPTVSPRGETRRRARYWTGSSPVSGRRTFRAGTMEEIACL